MYKFPKIIHQCIGFEKGQVSTDINRRIEKNKTIIGFKYMLWQPKDGRDFIKDNFDWFLNTYDNYRINSQRQQALVYFILYKIGGIFISVYLEPIKDLNVLLEKFKTKRLLLYRDIDTHLINTDFIVSRPKNRFWKYVWNNLISSCYIHSFDDVLLAQQTTGTLFLDNTYETFALKRKYVSVISSKYINNCDKNTPRPCANYDAYFRRHSNANSSHSFFSIIKRYFIPILIIFVCITLFFHFVIPLYH